MSIRHRLTLSFVAVLLAGMALAAALAWRLVEQQYLDTQRENLLAQARLTASRRCRARSSHSRLRNPTFKPPTRCPASTPA